MHELLHPGLRMVKRYPECVLIPTATIRENGIQTAFSDDVRRGKIQQK
jgi:hypothetical protein